MVAFADKTMVCRDCGANFVFTAGEQEFYKSKGVLHEPTRGPTCRASRRRNAAQGDAPRTMYPAVCADCGATTEVPFEPTQGRPVYCKECFEAHRRTG